MDRPFLVLGKNIAKRRKACGFRKAEIFAEKIGMGLSGLRDIERGKAEGRIENRLAIAQALKCSLSDLYSDPAEPPRRSGFSAVGGFLHAFGKLSHFRQNFLLAVVYKDENYLDGEPGLVQAYRILTQAHGK